MKQSCLALAAILFVTVAPGLASAQDPPRWLINPYVGIFLADEGGLEELADTEGIDVSVDPAALVGARLNYTPGSSWSFEAVYGYSPVSIGFSDQEESLELDADVHLYYAAVNYTIPGSRAAEIFFSGGAGGILVRADEDLFQDAENSSNDFLLNVGAGLLWWVNERLAVRGDVKDHIQFCNAADNEEDFSACPLDDNMLNHIEASGGVSFLIGGS
jgi:hypothetical protein